MLDISQRSILIAILAVIKERTLCYAYNRQQKAYAYEARTVQQ